MLIMHYARYRDFLCVSMAMEGRLSSSPHTVLEHSYEMAADTRGSQLPSHAQLASAGGEQDEPWSGTLPLPCSSRSDSLFTSSVSLAEALLCYY